MRANVPRSTGRGDPPWPDHSGGQKMAAKRAVEVLYPETPAGGFSRFDHKVQFFSRVNAVLLEKGEGCVVLDYGAGRGEWGDGRHAYQVALQDFRKLPSVSRVIGVDVDDVVLTNPYMDETHVIQPDGKINLPDNSVDVIVSYAVFEHIEDPVTAVKELNRVLKPGGWVCAWTPNKLGYVAVASSMVPNRLHAKVLRRIGMVGDAKGQRGDADVFPTFYRLNTLSAIDQFFTKVGFTNHSYVFSGPEGYAGRSMMLARVLRVYNWILPQNFGTHLYVFCRKAG